MEGRKKETWHGEKFRENIGKVVWSGKSNDIPEGNQCIWGHIDTEREQDLIVRKNTFVSSNVYKSEFYLSTY